MSGFSPLSAEVRLLSAVEFDPNSGCWLWAKCADRHGYGGICFFGRRVKAHRLSYEVHNGAVPAGLHVLHKCDTPACINPSHLRLGTQADNMSDKTAKGRQQRGSRAAPSVITEDLARAIYARFAGGIGQGEISREFGLTRCIVRGVCTRRTWRHVTDDLVPA